MIKEIVILTAVIIIAVALVVLYLPTFTSKSSVVKTKTLAPEETFHWNCGNLSAGKKITWEWTVEQQGPESAYDLEFCIQDSEGTQLNDTTTEQNQGTFVVPYKDSWTLVWKNPYTVAESYSPTLELKYTITIPNQPPLASIQATPLGDSSPLTISFKGAGLDYDGIVTLYYWDFGDGKTSTLQNPTHTYSRTGTFDITLTVIDNEGASGKSTTMIHV